MAYDDDEDDETFWDNEPVLWNVDPDCEHEIELRWSGYGCKKCPGWYCA